MEILSIWRRERCCLSVIVLARAAVVSSFRGRRSVGRPSLPKGTRHTCLWHGVDLADLARFKSDPRTVSALLCDRNERKRCATFARTPCAVHHICASSPPPICFLAVRPSVRPSFQEKHVYVATATMCFILFSSLSFPRDDVPASPSSASSGRLMHDDGR